MTTGADQFMALPRVPLVRDKWYTGQCHELVSIKGQEVKVTRGQGLGHTRLKIDLAESLF